MLRKNAGDLNEWRTDWLTHKGGKEIVTIGNKSGWRGGGGEGEYHKWERYV